MTERGNAPTERATACPFVAFDDDRDARSDRPDHRHRCYAELRPAPRAIAHQEAFCLSAGFAACPTFQDWAKREAAASRPASSGAGVASAAGSAAQDEVPEGVAAAESDPRAAALAGTHEDDGFDDDPVFRPKPVVRDWAAPPPWSATGAGPVSGAGGAPDVAAEGAGLAASRWLVDGPTRERSDEAAREPGQGDRSSPAADGEAAHTPAFLSSRAGTPAAEHEAPQPRSELAGIVRRPRVVPARDSRPPAASRPVTEQARPAAQAGHDDGTPSWERPHRFEAYPTLKTRVGMPNLSPLLVGLLALVIAALLLFNLPALFLGGAGQTGQATPLASPSPAASRAPTPTPAPTQTIYVVKPGDNLGSIAKKFGVSQKQILNANPDIKDANRIQIGQEIIIPTKSSEVINSASESPSASPSQ